MLKITKLYRPLPKKFNLIVCNENINKYFSYKEYVNISTLCKNLLELNDEALFNCLSIFSKTHYKYRDTLYYNLQTLNIEKSKIKGMTAYYILSRTENILGYEETKKLYHEILHIASSALDYINSVLYSGFSYTNLDKNKTYGEGLNEGYVELLMSRDVYEDKMITEHNDELMTYEMPIYAYVQALARQLEIIVGKDELEDMFFKNGFIRLKEFLLKYSDEKSIIKFFRDCDIAAIASEYENSKLNKKTLEAQEFLFNICKEFMPEKLTLLEKEKIIAEKDNPSSLTTVRMLEERAILKKNARMK